MFSQLWWLCFAMTINANVQRPGDGSIFQFPPGDTPQPFKIRLDESFLDVTLQKVRNYRPTPGLTTEWNNEGPTTENITDVATYWGSKYKWESVEQRINNEFLHFATTIPGNGRYTADISLHFIHHRAKQPEAIPLLLLHGWPSSHLEWSRVVSTLTDDPNQPFHVVAPDLPGFGFSPAPKQAGLGPRELAKTFDILMHQLGYEKYGIVTTDLGYIVGKWMVDTAKDNIIGHISDFIFVSPSPEDLARLQSGNASDEEARYMSATNSWFTLHSAYSTVHAQKPLAISLALADSPVGLLGWIWDLNHAISDGYVYTHEELITDAMMLWIPGPYANTRAYLEFNQPSAMNFPSSDVPTGVTEWGWGHGPFPEVADSAFAPKEWVERTANLVYFKRHDTGGHFPAITQPALWTEDVREFFYSLDTAKKADK